MSWRISLSLFAFGALGAVACSSSSGPSHADLCANSGAAVTVTITDYAFTPADINVIAGQSVCWQNTGHMTHTVTDNVAGRFNASVPSGQTFVYTFGFQEGYAYHCTIHSTMTGSVSVGCKPGELSC